MGRARLAAAWAAVAQVLDEELLRLLPLLGLAQRGSTEGHAGRAPRHARRLRFPLQVALALGLEHLLGARKLSVASRTSTPYSMLRAVPPTAH